MIGKWLKMKAGARGFRQKSQRGDRGVTEIVRIDEMWRQRAAGEKSGCWRQDLNVDLTGRVSISTQRSDFELKLIPGTIVSSSFWKQVIIKIT